MAQEFQGTYILAYIGSNYTNSDLKLNDVAKKMLEFAWKMLLNLKTFRQYLNKVCLEEVK